MTTTETTLGEISDAVNEYAKLKKQQSNTELALDILRESIIKAFTLTGMKEYTSNQGILAYLTTRETSRILVKEAKALLPAELFAKLCHNSVSTALNVKDLNTVISN